MRLFRLPAFILAKRVPTHYLNHVKQLAHTIFHVLCII